MKPKFRILKQGDWYYVQMKVLFLWFYEKERAPGAAPLREYFPIKFYSYEEAKTYIENQINIQEIKKSQKEKKKELVEIIEEIKE